jgi:hypothetical protein
VSGRAEATVTLVHGEYGWRIRFKFDDGFECESSQSFGTSTEAEAALRQWCRQVGAFQMTAQ